MSFPKYPAYKDSGVEWLGAVPEHWQVKRLKFIAMVQTGVAKGKDNEGKETIEVPYLRVANVQDGYLSLDDVATIEIPYEDLPRYSLRPGDVLMNEGGDFDKLGRGHVWEGEIEPCIHQNHVFAVRPTKISPYWLNAFTGSQAAQFFFMGRSKQSTNLASISSSNVMELPVVVPPDDELSGVLAHLDHETARIDALIEEQQRLIELLKEKRQAVISHAVTKGLDPSVPMKDSGVEWLGEVPAHWKMKRLKQLVIDATGIQMGPFGGMLVDLEDSDTGYKVYGQENTISGDFSSGIRWISESRYLALSNYHIEAGDIVLTRKGSLGNCRRISVLPQAGIIDSDTIRVRVQDIVMNPEYLELILHEAGYISTQLSLVKRGAILSGLNTEIIANLMIIAPSIEEQEELLQEVNRASSKFDQGISDCEYAARLLRERRSALISAAVTGKIDVRGWQPPVTESHQKPSAVEA